MTGPTLPPDDLWTEPLGRGDLCRAFGYGRNHFDEVIAALPEAREFCGRWRLPLRSMPSRWLLAKGYIVPAAAPICTTLPDSARASERPLLASLGLR